MVGRAKEYPHVSPNKVKESISKNDKKWKKYKIIIEKIDNTTKNIKAFFVWLYCLGFDPKFRSKKSTYVLTHHALHSHRNQLSLKKMTLD